jgi:hypothetical protein
LVKTLSRDISDHSPCVIEISIDIPKDKVFRFENYWMLTSDFMDVMNHGWAIPMTIEDRARRIGATFKNLRRALRAWHSQLSNLAATIENNKLMLLFLDNLEQFRDLSLEECNFRLLVQKHLEDLLEQQRVYLMQRSKLKWVTLGDENTKYFHVNATIKHNKNFIMTLENREGCE